MELGEASAAGVDEVVVRGRRRGVLGRRERLGLSEEGGERRHLGPSRKREEGGDLELRTCSTWLLRRGLLVDGVLSSVLVDVAAEV